MLEIGKKYKDGWGIVQTIGGPTKVNPEWVWTIQGEWYRQSDGRKITYLLVDASKPGGARRHAPAKAATYWDLRLDPVAG